MSISINNIVRFELTWRDTRFDNVIKNVLNFRCSAGEMPVEDQSNLIDELTAEWLLPWYSNLADTTYLRKVKITNVSKPNDSSDEKMYEVGQKPGVLASGGEETPQAAACIVRQAYSRGRKSIGRVFFGPLADRFANKGRVIVDPLSGGDLNELLAGLGANLIFGAVTLRPCVVGPKDTTALQPKEVRKHKVSELVVYMRSRRPGIGE